MKRQVYGSFRDEDCLALLCFVADHREAMTLSELAEGAGIARRSLCRMLIDALSSGTGSRLAIVAQRYHFEFMVHRDALTYPGRGKGPRGRMKIIEVIRRGYE